MAISDWPLAERPRERLLAEGAKVLSEAELVAVLLCTGRPEKSAMELGRELVHEFNGVSCVLEAGARLGAIKGLGPAKAAPFSAALELARRALQEELHRTS